ncbi:MAG: aldehyde dehydrogenase family protein [Desulfuromusa sp.]|jgi:acetaldehyde dehydrogenase (acetylating)|nr:aldehyde dehydrogenase family protein [Desulfuromusa sp.]
MADKDLASIQEARDLVRKARLAQCDFARLSQEKVDQVVQAIAKVMTAMAEDLAKLAVEETGYGNWEDKKQKNLLASEKLYQRIHAEKTVGVIAEDREQKIDKIAIPAGVVAALIPSTNPTSTTIYKAMIALKAGNGIVFSPHPTAIKCIGKTVVIIHQILKELNISEDLVSMTTMPTLDGTGELMRQADLILATGGPGMVKAAYSSGTPALGVGPGNVPVFIEKSADVQAAVKRIMAGKTFDYGTVCSSEQALVTEESIVAEVKKFMLIEGCYFLEGAAADKVKGLMTGPRGSMNPAIVGQPASALAQMAGIEIPAGTRLLVYEEQGIGPGYPFSYEKLTCLLGFYTVPDWQSADELCTRLLQNGGLGHSMAIHSKNEDIIRHFALSQPVSRLLVNTPSSLGAVGVTTNLDPSLTLGCGFVGGSSTSDNVGGQHLFNIRYVARGLDTPVAQKSDNNEVDIEAITQMVYEQLKKMNYVPENV